MSARVPPAATSLSPDEIAGLLDVPAFRGRQIHAWILERGATSFDEMTDLPADLRKTLPDRLRVLSSEVAEENATGGGTNKLLVRMEDGALVECVLIPGCSLAEPFGKC